jgi:hypothetical protein
MLDVHDIETARGYQLAQASLHPSMERVDGLQGLSGRKCLETVAYGADSGDGEHLHLDSPLSELIRLLLLNIRSIPGCQQSDLMTKTAQRPNQVVRSRTNLGGNIWSDVQDIHAG